MVDDFREFFDQMSPNWKTLMGDDNITKRFFYIDDRPHGIVLTHYDPDGVLMINAGTLNDEPFSYAMRRYIFKLAKDHDRLVLPSTKKDSSIKRYASYSDAFGCFYKGL